MAVRTVAMRAVFQSALGVGGSFHVAMGAHVLNGRRFVDVASLPSRQGNSIDRTIPNRHFQAQCFEPDEAGGGVLVVGFGLISKMAYQ
jgi:hypothetical protein